MRSFPLLTDQRSRPRGPRHRRILVGALALIASLSLVACGDDTIDLSALAAETFSTEDVWRGDERYVTVTITDADFLEIGFVETYLERLGFSPAVYERMNRTRALDGTQAASSDFANVTWTYHPDNGLQAVFEREDGR